MIFDNLSVKDKISVTKGEFSKIVRSIFENPELLKNLVSDEKISNDQSKCILKILLTNRFNSKTCSCCRRFDANKLQLSPIEKDLEPLLDIAQNNVRAKVY